MCPYSVHSRNSKVRIQNLTDQPLPQDVLIGLMFVGKAYMKPSYLPQISGDSCISGTSMLIDE